MSKTIYVSTTGNDANSGLTPALPKLTFLGVAGVTSILSDGDTIQVSSGNYAAEVPVAAIWTANDVIVLGPNAGINPNTQTRGAEAIINFEFYLNNVNVTIDGLSFVNAVNAAHPHGLCMRIAPLTLVMGGVPITPVVRNCILSGVCGGNSLALITGVVTFGPRLVNPVFENNLLHNFTSTANSVEVRVGDGGLFSGNVISANIAFNTIGPQIYGSTNLQVLNNVFENFYRSCLNLNGLNNDPMNNVLIEGNTFRNCAEQGIRLRVQTPLPAPITNVTIQNNLFENNDFDINIWSTPTAPSATAKIDGIVIVNNTFRRNTDRVLKPAVLPTAWPAWPQYANVQLLLLQPGATGSVIIQNNNFSAYGSYVPGQREYFGILVAGGTLTTLTIASNSISGLTESAVTVPDSAGVVFMTNYSLTGYAGYGALGIDAINLSNNAYFGFDNGISVFDKVGAVYGNLPVGVALGAHWENFAPTLTYGVQSAAGALTNATSCFWGDNSGPSGGALDPITNLPANGTGTQVSTYVIFDTWITQGVFVPPIVPTERTDFSVLDAQSAPTATPGSDGGNTQFMEAFTKGADPIYMNGETRYIPKPGIPATWLQYPNLSGGNNNLTRRNAGVGFAYNDRPGKFENPGKA